MRGKVWVGWDVPAAAQSARPPHEVINLRASSIRVCLASSLLAQLPSVRGRCARCTGSFSWGGKGMVVGFGARVVPSTTSNARGALLWVFGARGDIGAVTPVGHLKVAHWGSWGFWGLEKSSKVMRKSRDDDSFFCFRVSKGIERVTLEKKSRDLNAISALSRTISARSGDR